MGSIWSMLRAGNIPPMSATSEERRLWFVWSLATAAGILLVSVVSNGSLPNSFAFVGLGIITIAQWAVVRARLSKLVVGWLLITPVAVMIAVVLGGVIGGIVQDY